MLLSVNRTGGLPALDLGKELRTRMAKPQRHRLLHGFPLAGAMPRAEGSEEWHAVRFDGTNGRGLLAWRRLQAFRRRPLAVRSSSPVGKATVARQRYDDVNSNAHGHM